MVIQELLYFLFHVVVKNTSSFATISFTWVKMDQKDITNQLKQTKLWIRSQISDAKSGIDRAQLAMHKPFPKGV